MKQGKGRLVGTLNGSGYACRVVWPNRDAAKRKLRVAAAFSRTSKASAMRGIPFVPLVAGSLVIVGELACAGESVRGPVVPTGSYELEAAVGDQTVPMRLELLSIDDHSWGRLTVLAGREVISAVRGMDYADGAWRFAVGGPVRDMRLGFSGESVAGTITLGDGPPIDVDGERVGPVQAASELLDHHGLGPLGMAERAGEIGASFPTITPHGALIFSRHGSDLSQQTLMIAQPVARDWDRPEILEIGGEYSDRSPAALPDGSGIVFASDRPASGEESPEGYRLWLAPRLGSGEWGQPVLVEFDGGWDHDARQPSITTDGTLYFSSGAPGGSGQGDIYVAVLVEPGLWGMPRNVADPINSPFDEHGAFVAPDGSYMILTRASDGPGSLGGDDLYLSFRTDSGWMAPTALTLPVNTFANEYGAWVSPLDGHLYFTSDRYGHADIFRVPVGAAGLPTGQ